MNVLSGAPYGYRYVKRSDNSEAYHEVIEAEAQLVQGMLVCQQCGYALYRTSTRTTKRKLHYYRCLGSDAYRHLKGALCSNRPLRQDSLDEFVWREIIRLLDDPSLIRLEIQRRMEAAQQSDPRRRREGLRRERVRLGNSSERLVTAGAWACPSGCCAMCRRAVASGMSRRSG